MPFRIPPKYWLYDQGESPTPDPTLTALSEYRQWLVRELELVRLAMKDAPDTPPASTKTKT